MHEYRLAATVPPHRKNSSAVSSLSLSIPNHVRERDYERFRHTAPQYFWRRVDPLRPTRGCVEIRDYRVGRKKKRCFFDLNLSDGSFSASLFCFRDLWCEQRTGFSAAFLERAELKSKSSHAKTSPENQSSAASQRHAKKTTMIRVLLPLGLKERADWQSSVIHVSILVIFD